MKRISNKEFVNGLLRGELDFSEVEVESPNFSGYVPILNELFWKNDSKVNLESSKLNKLFADGIELKDLHAPKITMKNASLSDSNFLHSNFRGADLSETSFTNATLSFCNLQETNLKEAEFEGAWLNCANLKKANLEGVWLGYSNLTDADLRGANLRGVNFKGTTLINADLRSVKKLDEAKNLGLAVYSNTKVSEKDREIIKSAISKNKRF
ncbi:MAG: pentapeptide repeat-containing protein [Candidatus Aenigmatarchaeota archaeon]